MVMGAEGVAALMFMIVIYAFNMGVATAALAAMLGERDHKSALFAGAYLVVSSVFLGVQLWSWVQMGRPL